MTPPPETMTPPIAPDLLACPFCGGSASRTFVAISLGDFVIACDNTACLVQPEVHDDDQEKVVAKWNQRASPGEIPEDTPTVAAVKAGWEASAYTVELGMDDRRVPLPVVRRIVEAAFASRRHPGEPDQ